MKSCNKCANGKYSLTNPNDTQSNNSSSICKSCPPTAQCQGGFSLNLLSGFWRSSLYSDQIINCDEFSDYCL